MAVEIYADGVFFCSACAQQELDATAVAAEVNRIRPPGTQSGWSVSSDQAFRTGQPNPCVCEHDAARRHWLLEC